MNELIQLWQKAVQDELNVVPRTGLIADLFLAGANNYVDLGAMQAKLSTDLRQAFALASEAADAQRDAEKLRNEEFESERQLPMQSPFSRDTDRSNASTPSSSAGCPVERRGSRRPRSPEPNGGPPEEDSESESAEGTKLGYVHKSQLVANHLQGKARGGRGSTDRGRRRCCRQNGRHIPKDEEQGGQGVRARPPRVRCK